MTFGEQGGVGAPIEECRRMLDVYARPGATSSIPPSTLLWYQVHGVAGPGWSPRDRQVGVMWQGVSTYAWVPDLTSGWGQASWVFALAVIRGNGLPPGLITGV